MGIGPLPLKLKWWFVRPLRLVWHWLNGHWRERGGAFADEPIEAAPFKPFLFATGTDVTNAVLDRYMVARPPVSRPPRRKLETVER